MPSFSTRTIIRWHSHPPKKKKYLYEERITLWKAPDFDAAIERAEREAIQYAEEGSAEYLNYVQAYELIDDVEADGVEIYSLLRESDLPPKEYIDTFFDTGNEHERDASGHGE